MESKSDVLGISQFKTFEKLTSDKNLDCVAFCQVQGYEHFLLVAKYELNPNTLKYSGGFLLFDTSEKYILQNFLSLRTLKSIFENSSGAIFDLIWVNKMINGKLYFMTALVEPRIEIFSFDGSLGNIQICH
jgi:hypothetical protein